MFSRFTPKKIVGIFVSIFSIIGYGLFVFAAAPTGGYLPAQTLNPNCAPGDTDCFVQTLVATTATTYTWMGTGAGASNGSTDNTVFIGIGAGTNATNASYSNFIGTGAGLNATNANNSNFFGQLAGCNATNADNANFFGKEAGCYATNANNSNFFGNRAGYAATNADHSTFFGDHSGNLASSAYSSSFIGANAGDGATNAYQSNFFGRDAGNGAVNASDATFMGYQAGMNATNASGSLFAGNMAGNGADSANSSIILGYQAGYNAAGVSDFLGTTHNVHNVSGGVSFLGYQAGYDALGAAQSTFIGTQAGYKAYGASGSFIAGLQAGYNDEDIPDFLGESQAPIPGTSGGVTFIGVQSGYGAATAIQSTFIGTQAGYQAKNSPLSTFIGFMAGSMTNGYPTQSVKTSPQGGLFGTTAIGLLAAQNAYNAYDSVFLGNLVANAATDAHDSVFIGSSAGREAVNAAWSVFLGKDAGDGSDNAKVSTFLGPKAGSGAQNAKNSIFIGQSAGNSDPVFNSLATITYSNLANGPYKLGDWINGSISGAGGYIVSDNGSVLEIAGVSYAAFVPGDVISTNQPDDLATATVDSFTYGSSSILIGADSSTGGYSNSIALGAYAMNSATNQFIIGSQLSPINEVRIEQAGGTNCTITSIGLNCTSDENLKTNISDLSSNILDPLSRLRTVTYNWKTQPNGKRMIGFLAQDLEQYFPELVTTDKQGQKSVNYANMTPVLVEAVKELNVKLANIQTVSTTINPSLFESITNWLADKTNGINKLFVHEVCLTDGTDEECITMQQLRQLKAGQSIQQGVPVPEDTGNITTTPDTSTTSSDQGLGDATTTTSDSGVDPVSEPEGVTTDPSPIVPEPSPITETDTTTTP